MKLCPHCRQLLKNADSYCPYCAGEKKLPGTQEAQQVSAPGRQETFVKQSLSPQNLLTDASPDPPVTLHDYTATLELPLFDALPEQTADSDDLHEAGENPLPLSPVPAGQVSLPEERHDMRALATLEQGDKKTGAAGYIEQKLSDIKEHSDEDDDKKQSLGKVGIALLVILVLAAFFFGYKLYKKWVAPPDALSAEVITGYVEGSWLSEEFVYSDDAESTVSYVEYLVLDSNGTFTMQNLVPDNADADGYLTGAWEVHSALAGNYVIDAETKSVALQYMLDGETVMLYRQIVNIDQDSLTLREYYNDLMTDYFDVEFSRVG